MQPSDPILKPQWKEGVRGNLGSLIFCSVSCITIRIPVTGIEPAAILLKVKCSASELHRCIPYTNLNFPFIKAPCFLEVGLPTYLSIRLLLYIDFKNNIYYAVMPSSIQDGLVFAIKNMLFTELIFMFIFFTRILSS